SFRTDSTWQNPHDTIVSRIFSYFQKKYPKYNIHNLKIQDSQDPVVIMVDVQGMISNEKRWEKVLFAFLADEDTKKHSATLKCAISVSYAYSILTPRPESYDDNNYEDSETDLESLNDFRNRFISDLGKFLTKK